MERRKFLKGAVVGGTAAVAASGLSAPAIAQGKMEWRMVTSWPVNLPGPGTSAAWLADRITKMSEGKLTVKVFGAGQLAPAAGVFDAVSQGAAEMYHSVPTYWRGKSAGIVLFGNMPFGLTASEQHAWMLHGGGQALYDEMYGRFGLKGFLCGNTGNQWMGWFKKEIKSVEDFKGLRFRSPGLGGEMYRRMGASVVQLPGGEIYPALQSGTIDAAEFIGPWTDLALGFHQAAKFYYWPGVQEPASAEECVINKAKWDGLSDELKLVIETACAATYAYSTSEYIVRNPPALKTLVEKNGVQVRQAPQDVLVAAGNAAGEIMSELRQDKDDLVRKIADAYVTFREGALENARYTELGMMQARTLPYKFGG
ncbi:MAG: TRAP transporter substrate-binding protein [Alphaproteobacteria bacterium]|nr:TRAP transporter substrate-binding protein [Alphaproteobacteria bacterium]MBU0799096.1 TRAP transporter substrate-binding protein [Alphaproteobacteria bacterium]MBU0887627.1 TRAP transporter substrate-binding protein [Alphaproteobacteria bacterium]MBU1812946.1 TRAP transporter substrate-binding protein [Alphaproteobacteria bacterium]MBU2091792.1 TRAP transporter substrate-binding protein [Alphaproteobacteria bacterium]